jgi:hypothetical protein
LDKQLARQQLRDIGLSAVEQGTPLDAVMRKLAGRDDPQNR